MLVKKKKVRDILIQMAIKQILQMKEDFSLSNNLYVIFRSAGIANLRGP